MQIFSPLTHLYKSNHATTLGALLLILLLTITIFFETWYSMVSIWIRSETFTHGFFVIPASLWLISQNKALHPHLYPTSPSLYGVFFVLINGFVWLLASITQTLVIQQYALIGILVGSLWFYLGNNVIKKLLFPISFLYFMVPVGEALLPLLMEYTATFTIGLLRLTGLSVYREGMHFSLISGNWSVVEACGGLRYLLSSITLGVIYSYITFTKTYKRILFILFSIILPIIANGFRAYMIVMIGHLSDMTLAVGIDHLIYGAIFFAVIIFLMFSIGSIWKDPIPTVSIIENESPTEKYTYKQNVYIAITLIFSLGFWTFSSTQLQSRYQAQTTLPNIPALSQNNQWKIASSPNWGWEPNLERTVTESLKYFSKQQINIGLYQANFGDEKQGAELVNTANKLIQSKFRNQWHTIDQSTVLLKSLNTTVNLVTIRNNRLKRDLTTLEWYQIGAYATNNIYIAKLYQLYKRLILDTSPETYQLLYFNSSKNTDIDIADLLSKPSKLSPTL